MLNDEFNTSSPSPTVVIFCTLQYAHAWSAVAVLSVDAIFENYRPNISQGSAATPFRCDKTCNDLFIANFLLGVTVKGF